MDIKKLTEAMAAAEAFLAAARTTLETVSTDCWGNPCDPYIPSGRVPATTKRRSMDLTNALVDLRHG
jgi:hypothetical protein